MMWRVLSVAVQKKKKQWILKISIRGAPQTIVSMLIEAKSNNKEVKIKQVNKPGYFLHSGSTIYWNEKSKKKKMLYWFFIYLLKWK